MVRKGIALGALIAGLGLATAASAGEVVLRTKDGSGAALSGTLIEMTETAYVITSQLGPMNIPRSSFVCIGAACPDETATTASVAAPEAVVWQVSLWGKRRAFTEHVERLAELVEEKTGGSFTLDLNYGGLSPSNENLDGIAEGKFEMAQFCAGYHPEKTPSITVLELPFLGVDSLELEMELSRAVYDHPAVRGDLALWNATLLMPSPQPQYNIIGVGQPPVSLASFKGMSIRSSGGVGRAIQALGAEPITIPAPKVREALSAGEVQAVAFAPHAHMAFGTLESGAWWTSNLNPGTANCPVVVNNKALQGLSEAHQVALMSSVDEALDHYVANYNGATMDAWGPALEERFIIELTIDDGILAAIDEAVAAPAARAWIEENTELGLPAQELYDFVTAMISRGS